MGAIKVCGGIGDCRFCSSIFLRIMAREVWCFFWRNLGHCVVWGLGVVRVIYNCSFL